jgi:DNA-binding SARP family transcriptional activator/ATP/maltotriose-dependent transcriptional regulator MalT
VQRERLVSLVGDASVVVVVAPSGYGKTVFSEQLVDSWGLPAVRVRPRVTHVDRPILGSEVIDAIRRSARRLGFADLAGALVGDDPVALADLWCDLLAARRLDVAVVVDDAQLFADDGIAVLDALASGLPAGSRLVVCHRAVPRLEPIATAPGVVVVDADLLAMTSLEVRELLSAFGALHDAVGLVDDLLDVTGGWPAAVSVAAARLRDDPAWNPSHRSAGLKLLAGLVEGIVESWPVGMARVVRFPLLDRWVVERVVGPDTWNDLVQSGLPLRREGDWWSMPDAVHDAVVDVVGEPHVDDPSIVPHVAERYAVRGELTAALDLAVSSGRADVVVDLLARRHWSDLEAAGPARLASLLDRVAVGSVPAALGVPVEPLVAALIGLARAAEANHQGLRHRLVDRLIALVAAAGGDALPDPLRRAALAEDIRRRPVPTNADEIVAAVDELLAQLVDGEHVTAARLHLAAGHAGAMRFDDAAKRRAETDLRAAAELFGRAGEHRWRAEALARLGYNVVFHQGRFAEAAELLSGALSLLPAGDRTRARFLGDLSDVLDHLGRDVEALAAANESISIGARLRDATVQSLGLWSSAWILGRRGDTAGVHRALTDIERLHPGWLDQYSAVEFYGSIADQFLALGDIDGARRCIDAARTHPQAVNYEVAVRMVMARWEAVVGDPAAALEILAALDAGHGVGTQRNTDWVRMIEAAIAHRRLGDGATADALVDAAFAECADLGVPDLPLRFESRLIALARPTDPSASAAHEVAAHATVTVFGGFSVRRGADDVTPPEGFPSMLVKLVALRSGVTVDAAIDAMWPDADLDTGRARLRNTLNRLRARSGDLIERRGDLLVLGSGVVTDLQAFDAAAAEALGAEPGVRAALARHALSLHGGPLLPADVYVDWTASIRERVQRRYLALVDEVAASAEAAGALDEAARLLDLGLDADPLDEQRWIRLGRLLRRQGRLGAARQLVERATAVLDDLGIEPSAELCNLAT